MSDKSPQLNVTYYSQYQDVKDPQWKQRACGIICLKMILDFYAKDKKNIPTIDDLIKEGVAMGGHGKNGWIHDSLVLLAHNYGTPAYREEFKGVEDDGITKIIDTLEIKKPVIVSVAKQFKHPDRFHQVVLVGLKKNGTEVEGFYYHDPDFESENDGKNKFVTLSDFKNGWRKFAIFVG